MKYRQRGSYFWGTTISCCTILPCLVVLPCLCQAPWINEKCPPAELGWPHVGHIEFKNYQTRYRPELEPVLKDITIRIQGGEKVQTPLKKLPVYLDASRFLQIGVVGRTGAGKSTTIAALFRLIEATGGSIVIDGVNIADLGLHDIRSRLTVLPQVQAQFTSSSYL